MNQQASEWMNDQVAPIGSLGVPHLLVYGSDGEMRHVLTSSLEDAMVYAEHLANDCGEQSFRVFEMREVPMAVKRYYSVELAGVQPAPAVDPAMAMTEVGTPVDVAFGVADDVRIRGTERVDGPDRVDGHPGWVDDPDRVDGYPGWVDDPDRVDDADLDGYADQVGDDVGLDRLGEAESIGAESIAAESAEAEQPAALDGVEAVEGGTGDDIDIDAEADLGPAFDIVDGTVAPAEPRSGVIRIPA